MSKSSIEWTEATWNPTTGCNKISAGCKFCYAETMTRRLKGMGQQKYKDGFQLRVHKDVLKEPSKLKKPQVIFVNSMSDLFHDEVPVEFIQDVFFTMQENPQHIFQVLTKRAERLESIAPLLPWSKNVWMGVSVENSKVTYRIDHLRNTGAQVKFLSLEPLIGPLENLKLNGIDWIIVGGESGHRPRPMNPEWVLSIKDQCRKANVPFFFKQWGGRNKKRAGRILEGRTFDEMPTVAAQYPQFSK